MKQRYELIATVAKWTDSQGRKCTRTARIGTVFQSPKGRLSIQLELVPVFPGWSGFVAFRDLLPPSSAPDPSENPTPPPAK